MSKQTVEHFLKQSGYDRFAEAKKLNESEIQDESDEPYKLKYKAREIFKSLRGDLLDTLDFDSDQAIFRVAVLDFFIGTNLIETEELSEGFKTLESCIVNLEHFQWRIEVVNLFQSALNQTACVASSLEKFDGALELLIQAEKTYSYFKREFGGVPHMYRELFEPPDVDLNKLAKNREDHFEDTYTHTLYYLAQAYKTLGDLDSSAKYCHQTLKRQLNSKYDPVEWATHAAGLSQYYVSQEDFKTSRLCLASATLILKEADPDDKDTNPETSPTSQNLLEKYQQTDANIARCWADYGIKILQASQQQLEASINDECNQNDSHNSSKEVTKEDLTFDLELTSIENKITDSYVTHFDQARLVFLFATKKIEEAKKYYTIDEHCVDYVELTQDHSKLFKELVSFEFDFDRQTRMHKRRIDMLTEVLNELNPQHYLLICRQLMFEIAETYSSMLDLKLAKLQDSDDAPFTSHAGKKINLLINGAIKFFTNYVETLRDSSKKLPITFSQEDERPALLAYFYRGRLYGKLIDGGCAARLRNMADSLKHYQFIVDYIKNNPNSLDKIKNEFEICEEIVKLLPKQMERLREELES